jgi:hypothetical protein
MAGLNSTYRSDGCGGIHSADVERAISDGNLTRGSDGFLYTESGGCYGNDGTYYGGDDDDEEDD